MFYVIARIQIYFKGRVHCFSMQVVINNKNFGAIPSCPFQEKRTFNSEK